jgi:hypothetical protein
MRQSGRREEGKKGTRAARRESLRESISEFGLLEIPLTEATAVILLKKVLFKI